MKCGGWWVEGEAAGDEASFYNGAAKKNVFVYVLGEDK